MKTTKCYLIERRRDYAWWTGYDWTEKLIDAMWFTTEEDADRERECFYLKTYTDVIEAERHGL